MLMSKSCYCSEEPEIGATIKFHCKSCSSVVKKFTVKKPLKSAGIAAILACGGSLFLDYAISDNRYPLDVEFAVLEACASSHRQPMSYSSFNNKKKVCVCAFEDTMNEISYVRYLVDEEGFLQAFKNNAKNCR